MTRLSRLCAALGAAAALLAPGAARAQRAVLPAAGAQEAFFALRYRTLVNTVVTGRYARDSLYVPIGAVLSELQIDASLDPAAGTIHGFFVDPADHYRIDLRAGHATIGHRTIELPDSSFIISDVEIYALPSALARIFPLRFVVDLRNLVVAVDASSPLPVDLAAQRALRHEQLARSASLRPQAPLHYGRRRALFNVGVLDYALFGSASGSSGSASLDGGVGGALLGGDYELLGAPYIAGGRAGVDNVSGFWRYAFDTPAPLISEVVAGRLFSQGLRPQSFDGVRLTNQPLQPRTRLGYHLVTGTTQPGWQVELYLNSQLIAFGKADAQGHYAFRVPLTYGTSIVTLRLYGPGGMTRVEERRLQVPFVLVPGRRLDYDVEAGWNNGGRLEAHSAALYGLSDRLTVGAGLDVLDDSAAERPIPFASLSALLGDNMTVSLEAAPGQMVQLRHEAFLGSQTTYALDATYYPRGSAVDLTGTRHRLDAQAYVPLGPLPLTVRLLAGQSSYWSGLRTANVDLSLALNSALFRPALGYRRLTVNEAGAGYLLTHEITGDLVYQIFSPARPLRFLSGTLIDASADWGLDRHGFDRLRLEISRNITRNGRLTLLADRDNVVGQSQIQLRYELDLPSSRSGLAVNDVGPQSTVSGYVRGSVGFDPRTHRPIPSDREWLGQAGAAFRLFVDSNGDGRYEPGEQIITGNAIRFRQALETHVGADSVLRTNDLLPYSRYSVDVDQAVVPNPLWVPRYPSFSFTTDASTYKRIDVPFYAGAVIEGSVRRRLNGRTIPVAGVRVHVRRTDGPTEVGISTFSDGTFYYLGLPPGHYRMWVDSAQQRILKDVSTPAVRNFEVRPTANGEDIRKLDFLLRSAAGRPAGDGAAPGSGSAAGRGSALTRSCAAPSTAPTAPASPRRGRRPAPPPAARASARAAPRTASAPGSRPTAPACRTAASRSGSGDPAG